MSSSLLWTPPPSTHCIVLILGAPSLQIAGICDRKKESKTFVLSDDVHGLLDALGARVVQEATMFTYDEGLEQVILVDDGMTASEKQAALSTYRILAFLCRRPGRAPPSSSLSMAAGLRC